MLHKNLVIYVERTPTTSTTSDAFFHDPSLKLSYVHSSIEAALPLCKTLEPVIPITTIPLQPPKVSIKIW
jgi:hypothetical protein